jgi:hypothetical protein
MAYCYRLTFLALTVLLAISTKAQYSSGPAFRLGATVSFGLSRITSNNVGVGGLAGAEKMITNHFAAETEASYNYFTGDKAVYTDSKNKSYAVPLLAGMKFYPISNVYASLRAGAIYFLLNNMSSPKIRLAYGAAGGLNLPQKTNRLNLQVAYTSFRYDGITRGYATLAAAIIIR